MSDDDNIINELFQEAADHVQTQISDKKSLFSGRDLQLSIYALYKQATVGTCNVKKPGILDLSGRAKWDAWNMLGDLSSIQAMTKYVEIVQKTDITWKPNTRSVFEEGVGDRGATISKRSGMGPVFSILSYDKDQEQQQV